MRASRQGAGLKRWVRQGVISKAWLGTGEEATTVGPVFALDRAVDYVSPMIRNQSACGDMGMPIADVSRGYLAAANGPSRGRDVHIGSMAHHVVPPVSPVGVMVPVCAGIAMVAQMRGVRSVIMTWIGDGSAKAGPSHEGLNFAAVRKVPAIFIIQNNQVALGTRLDQHHISRPFDVSPGAYGVAGWSFNGHTALDVSPPPPIAPRRSPHGDAPLPPPPRDPRRTLLPDLSNPLSGSFAPHPLGLGLYGRSGGPYAHRLGPRLSARFCAPLDRALSGRVFGLRI